MSNYFESTNIMQYQLSQVLTDMLEYNGHKPDETFEYNVKQKIFTGHKMYGTEDSYITLLREHYPSGTLDKGLKFGYGNEFIKLVRDSIRTKADATRRADLLK